MLSAVCIPATRIQCCTLNTEVKFPVVIERGSHPFPFRTRQLSLSSPMILRGQLCGKVGRRRDKFYERPSGKLGGLFFFTYHHGIITPPDVRSALRRRRGRRRLLRLLLRRSSRPQRPLRHYPRARSAVDDPRLAHQPGPDPPRLSLSAKSADRNPVRRQLRALQPR